MNKKSILGLILFTCMVIAGLFAGTNYLIAQDNKYHNQAADTNELEATNVNSKSDTKDTLIEKAINTEISTDQTENLQQASLSPDTKTMNNTTADNEAAATDTNQSRKDFQPLAENMGTEATGNETYSTAVSEMIGPQLIYDCDEVDYKAYIPEMDMDSDLEAALDINNPGIDVDAEAAILFDAKTGKVLYYKNAVQAMFPASTAKLLTSLVALQWCKEEEEITIGEEITMIASDSTRAYLRQGQVLTLRNLLAGMLLPSGNDAAYAIAVYVGRKSLQNQKATKEEAVTEFARLMNEKADELGVKNSCFKTPDGYDAVGQYTTAYDMGLIGMAAAENEAIVEITSQSSSRNIFASGEDVTWNSTNKLIKKYSGQYYSRAIGLKTGTSTMAGRCLVAAAKDDDRLVVCVVMDSSSAGRWEDAISMLKYGLEY